MAAGPKRLRVAIQARSDTPDGAGGVVSSWATVATRWGELRVERASERIAGGRVEAPSVGVVVVRSDSVTRTITAAHRLLIGSAVWEITATPTNPDQRNRDIEIPAVAGVPTG